MIQVRRITSYFKSNKLHFLTLLFIFLYTFAAIVVSLFRYFQFESYYFDFGIFDRAIWLVSQFKPPIVYHPNFDNGTNIIFADHFNPSIFLFSPLYWITERREVLLVAQAIIVGISALVGYFLAKDFLKNNFVIFSLIFSYLGFVGMQNALITDFHEATVATLPLMIAIYAAVKKRWKIFYICLFIILGFKESFAGLGVFLGLFLIIKERGNLKHGLATIIISLIWAAIAIKIIIPFFLGHPYFYTQSGISLQELIDDFLNLEIRAKTLFYSFLNFGFLPLFNLSFLPTIAENFLERFLSNSPSRWGLTLHYSAPLSVLMFASSVLVMQKIEQSKKFRNVLVPYSLFIIAMVIFLHQFVLKGPLGLFHNPVFYTQTKNTDYIRVFLNKVPKDGLIMTQNDLSLRFSHENVILLDKNYLSKNPDLIILNLTPGQSPNNFFPLSYEHALELKNRIINNGDYRLQKFGEELYLFTKIE
ncbi:MAG: DUF2079 domain-containing protein [Patescibacteria group bacterium]